MQNNSINATNITGILEIFEEGNYGQVINPSLNGYVNMSDPYVTKDIMNRFSLNRGQLIECEIIERRDFPNPKVVNVTKINGVDVNNRTRRQYFEHLTPITPSQFLKLENKESTLTSRVIDMFCPIGRGQRGIIVAPPRTGKTLLLHEIAKSIKYNFPSVKIVVALIDERPEEVTDFKRSVDAEIFASANDMPIKNHIRVANLACSRAKSLAEDGQNVLLLIDSITRLARAHNTINSSGRTMSGGVDSRALEQPRRLFASARDTEEGASLTIIATALIDTGSRMDDLIFQEFKGTGNMEIVLSRKLAEMRIWPAIDIKASGTRREEMLIPASKLNKIDILRRAFGNTKTEEATESMIRRMSQFKTNDEFLNFIS